MTTGAGTRRALRAAGAPAAATAGVVHLPAAPERTPAGLGMLAHELSHAADHEPGPRLFGEGLLDAGERSARRMGGAVSSAATGALRQARRAERRVETQAERPLDRPPVASLPIGGAAAAVPAAIRAAEGVVADAGESAGFPMDLAQQYLSGGEGGGGSGKHEPGANRGGRAGHGGGGPFGGIAGAVGAIEHRADEAIHDAGAAAGAVAGQAMAAFAQGGQVDAMIEAIEHRLLAEMERRGGRFQGLF
jgi:Domain of unknown function (DUF4157)